MISKRTWLARTAGAATLLLLAWAAPNDPAKAQSGDVVVFAAASLKNALDAVNAQWTKETGKKAVISYAASSALAKQIEQGAPAQMFISADLDWMDYLAAKSLIKPDTRSNLLGNRIVLIAPKDKAQPVEIKPGFDLARRSSATAAWRWPMSTLGAGRQVRQGRAGEARGLGRASPDKIAQAENVRAALLLVSRGEAPAGIVYQTDAAADQTSRSSARFPENTHPPIIYPIALTASATHPDAAAFLAYIRSAKAKPLFEAQGFTVLSPGQS